MTYLFNIFFKRILLTFFNVFELPTANHELHIIENRNLLYISFLNYKIWPDSKLFTTYS